MIKEIDHIPIIYEKQFYDYLYDLNSFNDPKRSQSCKTTNIIYLYGFPLEEAKREEDRSGVDKGPESFRKGLKDFSLVPFEKIDSITMIDCGDVLYNILAENSFLESFEIARKKIRNLISKENSTLFFVGGTNDMTYPNVLAYYDVFPKKLGIINVNAHLDVEYPKNNKIYSNSTFRIISEEKSFINTNSIIYHFALQGAQNSKCSFQYAKTNKNNCFWLEKNIRHFDSSDQIYNSTSQAGKYYEKLLKNLSDTTEHVIVSFDLDSINSCFCPGVSLPSVIGGLNDIEAIDIFYLSGRCKKVISINLIGYNPAVENLKTKKFVAILYYYFCKGVSER